MPFRARHDAVEQERVHPKWQRMIIVLRGFFAKHDACFLRYDFERRQAFCIQISINAATMVQHQIPPHVGPLDWVRVGREQFFQGRVMRADKFKQIVIRPQPIVPSRIQPLPAFRPLARFRNVGGLPRLVNYPWDHRGAAVNEVRIIINNPKSVRSVPQQQLMP